MYRNLDVTALRALVAVSEMGGVTRAAAQLNLTQSAVSLQVKRLEETLDLCLIERAGRGVVLTTQGDVLVGYARRLLGLNDEIVTRMGAASSLRGEVRVGVPCDLLHLRVPEAMRHFRSRNPAMRVALRTEVSAGLHTLLEEGALDLILTTEAAPAPGAEVMARMPLVWIGAPGGEAWKLRPLPLAIVPGCAFTRATMAELTATGFDWTVAGEASMIESLVAADLGVYSMLRGAIAPGLSEIHHNGSLPALPCFAIAMYQTAGPRRALAERFADSLRTVFDEQRDAAA